MAINVRENKLSKLTLHVHKWYHQAVPGVYAGKQPGNVRLSMYSYALGYLSLVSHPLHSSDCEGHSDDHQ